MSRIRITGKKVGDNVPYAGSVPVVDSSKQGSRSGKNLIQIRVQDLDFQIRIQPRIFDDLSALRSPERIFMNT
jgi:hypothetical protein